MTKVGDIIWHFDDNRRVYERDGLGRAVGGPIYDEHFIACTITGEVGRSWLVYALGIEEKIAKVRIDQPHSNWFSNTGRIDDIWIHDHRHKICELIFGSNAATMRKVAEVIGYKGGS
jgi:hypothetical protein